MNPNPKSTPRDISSDLTSDEKIFNAYEVDIVLFGTADLYFAPIF